tara:strand:- start:219 stop:2084 length:1866 start_codon:yes stop_codon:yes gene_type:complete
MASINHFFLTNGKICNYNDYIKYINNNSVSTSILTKYINNIEENIKKNNIKKNNIKSTDIMNLDNIFKNFKLTNDVHLFCNELIKKKYILQKIKSSFNTFNKLSNKTYLNPLYNTPIDKYEIRKNMNLYSLSSNSNELFTQLDILYYGKYMNNNLPSFGPVDNIFNSTNTNNLSTFFNNIMTDIFNSINDSSNKSEKPSLDLNTSIKIPLLDLNFRKTFTDILLENTQNIDNIKEIKDLLNNKIETIKVTFGQILRKEIKNKKKTIKLFHFKYIIPYLENGTKLTEKQISTISKDEIKYKDHIKQFMSYSNKNNNILGLILNLQIQLFYDIHKKYIDNLSDFVFKVLKISSDDKFKNLNFKYASDYINKMNDSLLKLKLILLNNFYNLFLPNKIEDNLYGIIIEDSGCYNIAPGVNFLGNKINSDYPLYKIGESNEKCINFFTMINNKNDIYDTTELLELGIECYNKKYIHSSITILKKYYHKFENIDKFTLIIINKIIQYFNKYIIIENLEDLVKVKNFIQEDNLNKEQKLYLEDIIYQFFKENLKKSITSLLKIIEHKNTYKNEIKDIEILKAKIYNNISTMTFKIIENVLVNIDVKNKLISKCSILEKEYLHVLKQKK